MGSTAESVWRNRSFITLRARLGFKIVTAARDSMEGVGTPSQIVDCGNGEVEIASVRIREIAAPVRSAVVLRSDGSFLQRGDDSCCVGARARAQYRYIRKFDRRTDRSRSSGEASGSFALRSEVATLPPPSFPSRQEIGVTPIQMIQALSIVANGGRRFDPRSGPGGDDAGRACTKYRGRSRSESSPSGLLRFSTRS